tara:strand:+ start:523 stop:1290 length:768 start_codon:yes stop_codon:yes gene_type:complete
MRIRVTVLLAAVVATGLTGPRVDAQEAFFDEGNQRYQEGDFRGALDRYAQILDQGLEGGELYYNVGNAYFKLGELGPAILYYERARRLMPADEDLAANLELARSLTTDAVTPLPEFWLFGIVGWWVNLLPRPALLWFAALAYLAAMTGLIVTILRPTTPVAALGKRVAVVGAATTFLLGINLVVRELSFGAAEKAVVMSAEATVQSAPSEDVALQIFTVHEGTKVRIDRRSDDWAEIVLEDGKVGWTRADHLESI